jgi:quercetin dioxygenase-like cupin family protein
MTAERQKAVEPLHWSLEELQAAALAALEAGGIGDARLVDGRILAVHASPARENAAHFAVGTAALPPGFATRPHSHEAEELGIFLSGSGSVEIAGVEYPVAAGSVLLTPSNAPHITRSDPGAPLVVLWFYAPPGSEVRWLDTDADAAADAATTKG